MASMVHTRENGFRCGHFSGHTLYAWARWGVVGGVKLYCKVIIK
jgi:hypothetical protein